ncbi:hypothetical protein [Paenibacillus agricola]|uniref:Uncharacterized protein n=1 Tax=Paenibacillus agricola TaxID=2716264 RepID=A0ABX0J505_9BACL|nr:hypothetical protein [Paenibacillus agricola]NHN29186.1 hypothetical protein [Paenibacillus agricola]
MSELIQKTLLIKHVTSRMFVDSRVSGNAFSLSAHEGGWKIVVKDIPLEIMNEIKANQADLNLFYFEETEEGQTRSIHKWWIYDTVLPGLEINESRSELTLILNTRTGYSNEHVNKQ